QLRSFAAEVTRVAREVGTEGKLGGQAVVQGVSGTWKDLTDSVNSMAGNLTGQVRNIAQVTTAVANGDLSTKITVDVKGEVLELKNTINTMVDQLRSFASEVTRVAREVGTEGKLGGQAQVRGVAGVWKDLTDNVNSMAANLTNQVRGIANVVTAVASGDLDRKLAVEAKGEVAALAETINGMIDTLATFADQVTNVAREVGTEGKLGGQARVPGAAGLWRDLTENVNRLAANLTAQVRAIAEVATAVTKGDLTRSIAVEASGEVAALKDNINEMIRNLKDTTRKNTEQDWLKTHLARFTRMLQGHRDLVTVSRLILSELTPLVNAQQAAFYVADHRSGDSTLELLAGYAQRHSKSLPRKIAFGEGLVGQCAFEKKRILLTHAPSDYIRISSSLGSGAPANIVILPVLFEGQVKAVIELASFSRFSDIHQSFLDQLTESIGVVLHTIAANMQTEYLLHQSQSLTAELQAQQEELKKTNDRLEQQALNLQKSEALLKSKQDELRAANDQLQEKARQLSEQMHQVEFKNREIEQARAALEEKAEQLSLSSRYKSEFLANMSHELRTPLNSLLILARLLADNVGDNLTPKQVEFAKTIHCSGAELLALINDILDLAKIESGTVTLNITQESFAELRDYVERTFGQVALDKDLEFEVALYPGLPPVSETDGKRLQQILTNLLSNAFKFTSRGSVRLAIAPAASGWSPGHPVLDQVARVVAFSVSDTGIGIPFNKQRLIFEAFQQADGTTSREFGGTGLGLSISRELARLLGGEIRVASTPGEGSTFTLYLPLDYRPAAQGGQLLLPQTVGEAFDAGERPAPVSQDEAAEAAPQAAAELAGRKVLVVDDDIRNVFALASALEAHGMQVMHADSGKEGIEMLQRGTQVDAVLMDVMMPGLDGLDTMRIVRQLDGYHDVPIIAVTAKAMLGDREKCLDAGANDYIAKPVNIPVLLAALWRLLPARV
ncbi:MAG TPA: HAMP domain-containing protein, partial [Burkholderiales bacterium]|nr:HAMP domain-containing protein [Burkholderiales bacterium]